MKHISQIINVVMNNSHKEAKKEMHPELKAMYDFNNIWYAQGEVYTNKKRFISHNGKMISFDEYLKTI